MNRREATARLSVDPKRWHFLPHFRHVIGGDLTSADFTTRLKAMPNLAGRLVDVTRTDAVLDYHPARRPWAGLVARFAHTFAARETGFLKERLEKRLQELAEISKAGRLHGSPHSQGKASISPEPGGILERLGRTPRAGRLGWRSSRANVCQGDSCAARAK